MVDLETPDVAALAWELRIVIQEGLRPSALTKRAAEMTGLFSLSCVQPASGDVDSDYERAKRLTRVLRLALDERLDEAKLRDGLKYLFGHSDLVSMLPAPERRERAYELLFSAPAIESDSFLARHEPSYRELVADKLLAYNESSVRSRGTAGEPAAGAVGGDTFEPRPIPGDASEFIADVTVPDGTSFRPGEEFLKVWEIRNAGSVAWRGRFLMRFGTADGPAVHSSPLRVHIPDTEPGERAQVAVAMRASLLPGSNVSTWKMADSNGRLYFPDRYRYGLLCQVVTEGRH